MLLINDPKMRKGGLCLWFLKRGHTLKDLLDLHRNRMSIFNTTRLYRFFRHLSIRTVCFPNSYFIK
jgi:hypothetical protein